jgi:hypothetical protein
VTPFRCATGMPIGSKEWAKARLATHSSSQPSPDASGVSAHEWPPGHGCPRCLDEGSRSLRSAGLPPGQRPGKSTPFFFRSSQRPFNRAAMNGDTELLGDTVYQHLHIQVLPTGL